MAEPEREKHIHIIPRKAAMLLGIRFFYTGKPCGNGHLSERFASNSECRQCAIDRAAARRIEKPDAVKAAQRAAVRKKLDEYHQKAKRYRSASREAELERRRRNARKRPEAGRLRYLAWYFANKAKAYATAAKSRANRRRAKPGWYGELDHLVMTEAFHLAALRTMVTGICWHVDHMIPIASRVACGLHCAQNIQVIPQKLNIAKSNRMIFTEHLQWIAHVFDGGENG